MSDRGGGHASVMFDTRCPGCGHQAVQLVTADRMARCRSCGQTFPVTLGFKLDAPEHPVASASDPYAVDP